MAYEAIIYRKEQGVGIVTLNRPRSVNAVSQQMLDELKAVVEDIGKDKEVRVFIITGAPRPDGRPCFSAGMDLKEMGRREHQEGLTQATILDRLEGMLKFDEFENELARLLRRIERLGKPSIAVIDGICTTGAFEMVLACDFRLVSERAEIGDFHVKRLGHMGGGGVGVRLPLLVGRSKAKELILLSKHVDGREAYRIGLANQVYPADKLMEGALAFARELAGMNPDAVRIGKAIIDSTAFMDPDEAMRYNYLCWTGLLEATGGFERAKAFTEKRDEFTGHR